jgi:N-acetylneuraminic acid mutarotase
MREEDWGQALAARREEMAKIIPTVLRIVFKCSTSQLLTIYSTRKPASLFLNYGGQEDNRNYEFTQIVHPDPQCNIIWMARSFEREGHMGKRGKRIISILSSLLSLLLLSCPPSTSPDAPGGSTEETLEACSLSEAGGKKTDPFSLSISNPDSGATIWYTLDGSSPVAGSSLQYSSALSVWHSCTVKAIASKSGMNNSPEASEAYHFLWTSRAALATARYGACAAAIGAKVYVMGGMESDDITVSKATQVLDTTTDTWSTDDDLPQALYRACALAYGGQIYVFGGHDGSSAKADIYRFNPSASALSRWSKLSVALGTARFRASAALMGSRAYIVGGNDGSGNLASTEVADLSAMTVNSTAIDVLGTAVQQHTALAVGNYVYVFGGDAGSPDVLRLDPSAAPSTQWTTLTGYDAIESFDMAAGGTVNGKAYTIGGYWTAPPYADKSCRSFDPAGPSAASGTDMPTARYEAACAVVNGTIIVIGGITSPSPQTLTDAVEQYDPAAE